MTHNSISRLARLLGHRLLITFSLIGLLLSGYLCQAATPVLLAPLPQLQFFDQGGRPLAFGCVFTYQNNSTTPLATFTDYTGTTQNTNPVILSAGGSANIWMQAGLAYMFRVKAAGGTNCAAGSSLYTVNGIGGGVSTLTTLVTYSATPVFNVAAQNQLFIITLTGNASSQPLTAVGITPPGLVTWEIIQDGAGGHTFTWPSNVIGGCTIGSLANQVTLQHFIWDGTNAIATGPCVIGQGPDVNFDIGTATALVSAACANPATAGFIRLCSTDSIFWRNFGNSGNQGITPDASDRGVWSFAGGLLLSGTTPDIFFGGTTASFPRLKRNGTAINVRLADDSGDAPLTASTIGASGPVTSTSATHVLKGPEVVLPAAPGGATQIGYYRAGKGWCAEDSAANEYCTASNSGAGIAVQAASLTLLGAPVAIAASPGTTNVITKAVTMPSSGCPCRAFVSYGVNADTTNSGLMSATVNDGTNSFATNSMNTTGAATDFAIAGSAFSTGTYTNGAAITFTLRASQTMGGVTNIHVNNATGIGTASFLNIAIFTSN
jgi:hypothetical protein